jgi:hypothetical protein
MKLAAKTPRRQAIQDRTAKTAKTAKRAKHAKEQKSCTSK